MKLNNAQGSTLKCQQGFTLIELIMVIVLIGILAVVAIPQYADMEDKAAEAMADGVYLAAQGAAAINFAANLVGATPPAGGVINNGTTLLAAMDETPEGWTVYNIVRIRRTINSTVYMIRVYSAETATRKAVITKNW